jgi:rhamnose utilization protein RhaD (predicted bifunctional aldolase and dehydrogenase)/NAD(P)-dependent dehydrogenase (short-subunit alcohol dehydrogenase family)
VEDSPQRAAGSFKTGGAASVIDQWNQDALRAVEAEYPWLSPELAARIYTSRLLGSETALVLHGGGNTSVKVRETDLFGEPRDVLYVKGSGGNLADIGPAGFVGLDLEHLRRLQILESLSDDDMESQINAARVRADGPAPSVEALVHAFLPHRFIDHTHSDAILILSNLKDGRAIIEETLGARVAILPYVHPGFPLALDMVRAYIDRPDIEAVVFMGHGIFTFADNAKESYQRMIQLVSKAEARLAKTKADDSTILDELGDAETARAVQVIRGACAHLDSNNRLCRFVAVVRTSEALRLASVSNRAMEMCQSGVLTPDHCIRTKNKAVYIDRIPSNDKELWETVKSAVKEFTADYHRYYSENVERTGSDLERLDPYPRVFLVSGLGVVALGTTRRDAIIAADIAEHTFAAKLKALDLGPYKPLSEDHLFEMEYWLPQLKKLARRERAPLEGQTALVTGGGGAIGFGVADRLLHAGANVVITDIDVERLTRIKEILGGRYGYDRVHVEEFDVTDFDQTAKAVDRVSRHMGGLDILVPNAGVAHVALLEDLDPEKLDFVIGVNLKGVFNIIKAAVPVFKRQNTGGNVVIVSSKNVFDPGASFGAYSASKAGAHQLGKIAALELANYGVRVNMLNPDAVFSCEDISSKLWDLVGPDRMRSRGLDPSCIQEYYCDRNLLKAQVTAEHVGNAVVFFASDLTPTTGATLPVDGGVQGAFPR